MSDPIEDVLPKLNRYKASAALKWVWDVFDELGPWFALFGVLCSIVGLFAQHLGALAREAKSTFKSGTPLDITPQQPRGGNE